MSFFNNSYIVRDAADQENKIVKDGIQIGENAVSSLTNDVVNCEVCGVHIAKYKCPGCFCQTCSLSCSKQHKLDTTCSGVRSKTHFVERKQYSEKDMMSDYSFLEEVGRTVDNAARENMKRDAALHPNKKHALANNHNNNRNKRSRNQSSNNGANDDGEDKAEEDDGVDTVTKISLAVAQELEKQGSDGNGTYKDKQLVMQAKKRNIHLIRIAEGLKKRKENNTHWRDKPSRILWTVEWIFPEVEASRRVLEQKCEDTKTLDEILSGFMDNEENKDLLEKYPTSIRQQLKLFFVIPLRHANKPALYPLKNMDNLLDAFKFKKILEYPTILVLGPSTDNSSKSANSATESTIIHETSVSIDNSDITPNINNSHPILEKYTIEEPLTQWPRRLDNNNTQNGKQGHARDKKRPFDTTEDSVIDIKKSKLDSEDMGEIDGEEDTGGDDSEEDSDSSSSDSDSSSSDSSSDSDSDADSEKSEDEGEDNDNENNGEDEKPSNRSIDDVQNDELSSTNEAEANLMVGQAIIEAFSKDFGNV